METEKGRKEEAKGTETCRVVDYSLGEKLMWEIMEAFDDDYCSHVSFVSTLTLPSPSLTFHTQHNTRSLLLLLSFLITLGNQAKPHLQSQSNKGGCWLRVSDLSRGGGQHGLRIRSEIHVSWQRGSTIWGVRSPHMHVPPYGHQLMDIFLYYLF